MGYDAVAVGPLDLAAGTDFLKQQGGSHFPWISSNLLNADDSPVFRPFIIKKTGQSRTGIIGLTGKTASLPANLHTGDWHTILPAQLQIVSQQCDHIILLSNLSTNDNDEIALHYPNLHIIISVDPQLNNPSMTVNNNTLITQTAQQGKYLGRLDVVWRNTGKGESDLDKQHGTNAEGTIPFTFTSRFIALQSSLPESVDVEKIVSEIQQKISKLNSSSQQTNIIHNETHTQKTTQPAALFTGFEQCRTCHRLQADFWKSTRHAGAYATLIKKGQANNLECLPCHVTNNAPLSRGDPADILLSLPSSMQAVGCEVCHGAGLAHVNKPENIKPVRRADKKVCLECHTNERDADFNYENKIKLIQCPTH
jgi:2',3'-cyclic-nucleotide 2'-phosphodiesterase (5'-nucleotidase family)